MGGFGHIMLDEGELRAELGKLLAPRGGGKRLAADLGVSTAYISRVRGGFAPVSDRIAVKLGYRRVTMWVKCGVE